MNYLRLFTRVPLAAVIVAACTDFTEPPAAESVAFGVSNQLEPIWDIELADGFQASVFYDQVRGPDGIGVLSNSKLLIVKETGDSRGVYRAKKGQTYEVADSFSTLHAPFVSPDDLVIAADHTVYVADGQAGTVFRIPKDGGVPEAFVTTASTRSSFNPFGVAIAPATFDGPNVDPGDLIVLDNAGGNPDEFAVWAVTPGTGATRILAEGSAFESGPIRAGFAGDGTCFLVENWQPTDHVRIVTLSAEGTVTEFFEAEGNQSKLAIHPVTAELFFSLEDGEIYRLPRAGGVAQIFAGNIGRNQDIEFNGAGTILYVSAPGRQQVIQISAVPEVWLR